MKKSILLVLGVLLLSGCKPSIGDGPAAAYSSTPFNSALLPRLSAQPETASITGSQFLQIVPAGGVTPYHYAILSGDGQIGYLTGQFQSANVTGDVVITITDSSGQSTTVNISVTANGSSTTATNVTSNCTSMLNSPTLALMDSSPTGLEYALGSVPITSASSCAAWCGGLDAGHCMFSPGGAAGSGATPVCVAWPPGTSVSSYTSAWATYAGTCQ